LGKSGYLPSISGEFLFWKQYSVNCLSEQDWDGAKAGLYNLNQCLTADYAVRISNTEYNNQVSDKTIFQCNYCTMEQKEIVNKGEEDEHVKTKTIPNEIHYSKINIVKRKLSTEERLLFSFSNDFEKIKSTQINRTLSQESISDSSTKRKDQGEIKYWKCPDCTRNNYQKNGEWSTIKSIREKPFSLGVVQEPPRNQSQLITTLDFPIKFIKWFYAFLEEIQAKMVEYRIEYVSINGHDMEESSFKDKGDNNGNH
jgi:hypothetical protein